MNYIKLTDFIKIEPKPFICGAFLSRIMEETICGERYFYAYSQYKTSKFVYPDDFNFKKYASEYKKQLDVLSGYHNWEIIRSTNTITELRFRILCNIDNFTKNQLYSFLYKTSTTSDWAMEEEQNEEKRNFIRGFAELRGSIDTTAKYITQDYFYDSKKELKKSQILTDTMNISINYANFNSRELQPQYVSGENQRNSQFRINLFYYASEIGFINKYKAKIFENAYNNKTVNVKNDICYYITNLPQQKKADSKFINYLNYYSDNIYKKDITASLLKELRKDLNFSDNISAKHRNSLIVKTFETISPDICACCGTTTTYTKPNGKQYFEIHHVISYANGNEMDNIANLVKLCPTCHRMMKKGSGQKEEQIEACKKIIHEHEEIYDFASAFFSEDDEDKLAFEIQKTLK